jgi:hypothetical protein
MRYQFTENQIQVQVLMQIVYMPMIALKVGKYPLIKIISQHLLASQLSAEEQKHTKDGIKALVELGIFAQDGNDICITNLSEGFIGIFDNFSLGTEEQVHEELKSAPKIQAIFSAIERDARLRPYSSVTPITTNETIPRNALQTLESKPMSFGDKFTIAFLFIVLFLGLIKIISKY